MYFFIKQERTEDHKDICKAYDVNCLTGRTCQNWFKKFRSGDFYLKKIYVLVDRLKLNDCHMKDILESNWHITMREIAKTLNVSHYTVKNHIKLLGLAKKLNIWVPELGIKKKNN